MMRSRLSDEFCNIRYRRERSSVCFQHQTCMTAIFTCDEQKVQFTQRHPIYRIILYSNDKHHHESTFYAESNMIFYFNLLKNVLLVRIRFDATFRMWFNLIAKNRSFCVSLDGTAMDFYVEVETALSLTEEIFHRGQLVECWMGSIMSHSTWHERTLELEINLFAV